MVPLTTKSLSLFTLFLTLLLFLVSCTPELNEGANSSDQINEAEAEQPIENNVETPKVVLNEFGEDYKPENIQACVMAQKLSREEVLLSPTSAVYGDCSLAKIEYLGNQTYRVLTKVDSQNGFGTMVRSDLLILIKDSKNGIWETLKIDNLNEGLPIVDRTSLLEKSLSVNTNKGVTLAFDDYKTEVKNDNFGKVTEISLTILNEGTTKIYPEIRVFIYDQNDKATERANVKETIKIDGSLAPGKYTYVTVPVNIGFTEPKVQKTLKLTAVEQFEYPAKLYVSVEKEIKVS